VQERISVSEAPQSHRGQPVVCLVYTVAVRIQSTHHICSNAAITELTKGPNTPQLTQPTSGSQCSINLALHESGVTFSLDSLHNNS